VHSQEGAFVAVDAAWKRRVVTGGGEIALCEDKAPFVVRGGRGGRWAGEARRSGRGYEEHGKAGRSGRDLDQGVARSYPGGRQSGSRSSA
jgi:hypothetical protein